MFTQIGPMTNCLRRAQGSIFSQYGSTFLTLSQLYVLHDFDLTTRVCETSYKSEKGSDEGETVKSRKQWTNGSQRARAQETPKHSMTDLRLLLVQRRINRELHMLERLRGLHGTRVPRRLQKAMDKLF